jgi:ribonuclease HI
MTLRGAKVFARCDEAGELVLNGGKVEIRYKTGEGKAYSALATNLGVHSDSSVRPDSDFGPSRAAAPVVPPAAYVPGSLALPAPAPAAAAPRPRPATKKTVVTAGAAPTSAEVGEAVAYADGACSGNPGPAGLGVVLLTHDKRRELSEYIGDGTNNIAELLGIQRAAEAFPSGARILHVYTDSSYAIGVLSKGWKAKANIQLIAGVKAALAKLPAWELHHVRGHHGVPLNERADVLAVSAVSARRSTGWVDAPL